MKLIGLDPGVTTGFAIWDREEKRLTAVTSMLIHEAMEAIRTEHAAGVLHSVTFEDARLRTWFGTADKRQARSGSGIREGVGSVKRDCQILEDFMKSLGIKCVAVKPARGATKWSTARFAQVTHWTGRTNNHGRDAACLVFGK